jgi:hypothetical protein
MHHTAVTRFCRAVSASWGILADSFVGKTQGRNGSQLNTIDGDCNVLSPFYQEFLGTAMLGAA